MDFQIALMVATILSFFFFRKMKDSANQQDYFKEEVNVELLNDEMRMYQTSLQNIHFYNLFYKNYSKKIVSIDSELKTIIEKTFKPDIDIINKISFLCSLIK